MENCKKRLLGMTLPQIKEAVTTVGMPAFTAKQIADWVYKKRVRSIDEMSNISIKNRERLAQLFEVGFAEPVEAMRSVDGTIKYLYKVDNSHYPVLPVKPPQSVLKSFSDSAHHMALISESHQIYLAEVLSEALPL